MKKGWQEGAERLARESWVCDLRTPGDEHCTSECMTGVRKHRWQSGCDPTGDIQKLESLMRARPGSVTGTQSSS